MAETTLDRTLTDERSVGIRTMLRHPLLDTAYDVDAFRNVVRHRIWLEQWFEDACGWPLVVDVAAGFARLVKRTEQPDATRPLLRTRGTGGPFDRRRYQLLCLVAAELVRHPATTVGLLAAAITAEAGFDSSRYGERVAFVDALRALIGWGALRPSAGEVDAYVDDNQSNALLVADTARLHRLLSSATSASALAEDVAVETAVNALAAEPRYGAAAPAEDGVGEQRLRWLRHSLARKLLDDPAVHIDDLSAAEAEYAANPAGRRWLRDRMAEAGFELEERIEGFVGVDPDGIATDRLFPAPNGNVYQVALLLVDHFLDDRFGKERRPIARTRVEVESAVDAILDRFPGWARSHRTDGGPARLATDAVALLSELALVRVEPDGTVSGRPAIARYRAGEPIARHGEMSRFEDLS